MERRDPDSPTRVGEVLADKYVLEELLGAGGMGEVYRAHNALAGRTVAIKVLKSSLAKNREFVARFVREARAANIVRHPNVVDVLDVGQDAAGVPFIVQECLEGYDLAQHLHDLGGRLPVKAVLDLMIPVVDAVAAAHAKGVVHRDLKPDNVFLAKQSGKIVPKLLDFGISKMDVGETARLTAAEFTLGTPAYMSPEQIMGERNVDPRTDVWSLGVMLFEVLTGRLPFHAEEPRKLIVEIATEDVTPLAKVAPHVPQELSEAVARCLARKRELRFANAAELAKTLRAVRDLESVHTPAIAWVPPDPESVRTRARMLRAQTIAAPNSSPPPAADAEIGTEVSLEADLGGAKAAPEPEPEPEPELELEPEAELDAEPPRRSAIAAAPSRATPPAPRPPPPPVPQRRPGAASSVPELALDAPPPPRPASPPPPAAPSSSDAVSLDLDESGPSRHSRPSGRPSVASSPPASVGEGVNRVPVASASLRHSSGPPSRAPAPLTEHERAASTASSDDRSLYAGVVTASLVLVGAGLVLVANQLVLDVHPPASLVDVTPLAAAAAVVALLVGALASRAGYRAWLAAERSRALVAMAVAAMAFASCLQITRDIGRVGEAPASSAPR